MPGTVRNNRGTVSITVKAAQHRQDSYTVVHEKRHFICIRLECIRGEA